MLYDRLHAWLLTQSRLITLLPTLHAGGLGLRFYDGSSKKGLLEIKFWVVLVLYLWSGPPESYCWFSFALAFQLFYAVESSSLFHHCNLLIFCVLGNVALMS